MCVNDFYKHVGYSSCQRARMLDARVNPALCQSITQSIGNDYLHTNGKIHKMIYKVRATDKKQCQNILGFFSYIGTKLGKSQTLCLSQAYNFSGLPALEAQLS